MTKEVLLRSQYNKKSLAIISKTFFVLLSKLAYFFIAYLKSLPMKRAAAPSSSSIRNSWLYFAILSEREAEPVLIWPQFNATAKSAMVASSVSPERWDITEV